MLGNEEGSVEKACKILLVDYKEKPCTTDPWWFSRVADRPSLPQLIARDAVARVRAGAELAEIYNASIECNNASVRRFVRGATQCRYNIWEDISAFWALHQIRRDGTLDPEIAAADAQPADLGRKRAKTRPCGGGGGQLRALVLMLSQDPKYKLEHGRLDFVKIHEQYAMLDPHGEIMHAAAQQDELAIEAWRSKRLAKTQRMVYPQLPPF